MSLNRRHHRPRPCGHETASCGARALALPDWCIAAGSVRNRVWDHLHGIAPPRPPARYRRALLRRDRPLQGARGRVTRSGSTACCPACRGRCATRRACMSGRTCRSIATRPTLMTYWLETVTAVGVRLEADDTPDGRSRRSAPTTCSACAAARRRSPARGAMNMRRALQRSAGARCGRRCGSSWAWPCSVARSGRVFRWPAGKGLPCRTAEP